MQRAALEALRCLDCGGGLDVTSGADADGDLEAGKLRCPRCAVEVPVLHGMPLFTEPSTATDLDAMERRLFGRRDDWQEFVARKERRPAFDLYAAYDPFDEAMRSVLAFVPMLRERLRPGDRIVDLRCRTGWSAELLASLFPEQSIVAMWHDNRDVLGYRGFAFWLPADQRAPNLEVMFAPTDGRLPFADDSFAVVFGVDLLHYTDAETFLPECLRIATPEGALLFPHIHMSNSQPEPFFERGGIYRHGTWYRDWLAAHLDGTRRAALVASEVTLLHANRSRTYELVDEADTGYRNGCAVVSHSEDVGRDISSDAKTLATHGQARSLLSPLMRVDPATGQAEVDAEGMAGGVSNVLQRHRDYHEVLRPNRLGLFDRVVLYWAERGLTVREIAARIDAEADAVLETLLSLEHAELLRLENVSGAMARLHTYYRAQRLPAAPGDATLGSLWCSAQRRHAGGSFLEWAEDGSVFRHADADRLVRMAAALLVAEGVQPGDRIVVHATGHPEFVIVFWATVLVGAVVVPVSPEMTESRLQEIVARTGTSLLFVAPETALPARIRARTIAFGAGGGVDAGAGVPVFAELMSAKEPIDAWPPLSEDQDAAVFFASDSDGAHDGVIVSHGALFRSSRNEDLAHAWTERDRVLCCAGLATAAALRRVCITPLHSGAAVLLAGTLDPADALATLRLCADREVSVLHATPAFVAACLDLGARTESFFRLGSLRLVLCAGGPLPAATRQQFGELGVAMADGYECPEVAGPCPSRVGQTCESMVAILDDQGDSVPVGDVGQLVVYSENLSRGHESGEPLGTVAAGWFPTGDRARLTERGDVVLAHDSV